MNKGDLADYRNLPAGTKLFNRYVVERSLGAGSSGVVYLCSDSNVNSLNVAVKLISASISSDSTAATRLGREIRVGNKIDHQNVVRLYDCVRDESFIGLVLEHVPGEPISRPNGMDLDGVAHWLVPLLIQVCNGLEAIHHAKILHRDLKPMNLILTLDARIKIADLGLAKFIHVSGGDSALRSALQEFAYERHATWAGDVVGTFDYLPPEYLERGEFDERGDQYALGVCSYELLVGALPFRGEHVADMIRAKVENRREIPPVAKSEFVGKVFKIIDRMLARMPTDRFKSVAEVRAALMEVLKGEQFSKKAPPQEQTAPKVFSAQQVVHASQNVGRWFLIGALAVVAAIILLSWTRALKDPPPPISVPADAQKKSRFFGPGVKEVPARVADAP